MRGEIKINQSYIIVGADIKNTHINFKFIECTLTQLGCKENLKVGTVARLTLAKIISHLLQGTTKSLNRYPPRLEWQETTDRKLHPTSREEGTLIPLRQRKIQGKMTLN